MIQQLLRSISISYYYQIADWKRENLKRVKYREERERERNTAGFRYSNNGKVKENSMSAYMCVCVLKKSWTHQYFKGQIWVKRTLNDIEKERKRRKIERITESFILIIFVYLNKTNKNSQKTISHRFENLSFS